MAPEICTPPAEASSYESDVWSYGCIVLETTSGREPWIDQFPDDSLLFRALQRQDNAAMFARICSNQAGPSHLRDLLARCCTWSKTNRPRFSNILNNFRPQLDDDDDGEDTFSDAMAAPMSVESATPYEQSFSESEHKENIRTPTIHRFGRSDRVHQESNSVPEPEPVRRQARLTGEVFSSKGSASGRPIYEGVKGGRYYLTPSGSKVYLHK